MSVLLFFIKKINKRVETKDTKKIKIYHISNR